MSFDLSKLLVNVCHKAKGPKAKASARALALSKGKKWVRKVATRPVPISLGQSSKSPTLSTQPIPKQQARARAPCFGSDLLADDDDLMPTKSLEEYAECALIQSIVDKYEKEVDLHEGVQTLKASYIKGMPLILVLLLLLSDIFQNRFDVECHTCFVVLKHSSRPRTKRPEHLEPVGGVQGQERASE